MTFKSPLRGIQAYRKRYSALYGGRTYASKVLGLNPIAYWPLWETSGTVAQCLVNPAQNGTYARDVSAMGTAGGIGDGNTAPVFNRTNDVVDIYTPALAAVFDANEMTLGAWIKPSDWTSGIIERIMRFYIDASNETYLQKDAANNQVSSKHQGGGTADYQAVASLTSTDYYLMLQTISRTADSVVLYIYQNGVLVNSNSDTGLGLWAGPITLQYSTIGAGKSDATNTPFGGNLAHCMIFPNALSQAVRLALAKV